MQSISLTFYGVKFILVLSLIFELSNVLFSYLSSDYMYLKLYIPTCTTRDRQRQQQREILMLQLVKTYWCPSTELNF